MAVKTEPEAQITDDGFRWGAVEVIRADTINREKGGGLVVLVKGVVEKGNPQAPLEIVVSPTGKSIRVYRAGRELV